jgi:hypothetical protein
MAGLVPEVECRLLLAQTTPIVTSVSLPVLLFQSCLKSLCHTNQIECFSLPPLLAADYCIHCSCPAPFVVAIAWMHLEVAIAHLPPPVSLVVPVELDFVPLASQCVEHKLLLHRVASKATDMSMLTIEVVAALIARHC